VIDARVHRLGPQASVLLEGAAVIGGEVPLALWTRISGGDEDAVLALIDDAVAARLLTVLPDGAAVQFMHALTRDALYASISLTRRRALHRAVAEALMARATAEPGRSRRICGRRGMRGRGTGCCARRRPCGRHGPR